MHGIEFQGNSRDVFLNVAQTEETKVRRSKNGHQIIFSLMENEYPAIALVNKILENSESHIHLHLFIIYPSTSLIWFAGIHFTMYLLHQKFLLEIVFNSSREWLFLLRAEFC